MGAVTFAFPAPNGPHTDKPFPLSKRPVSEASASDFEHPLKQLPFSCVVWSWRKRRVAPTGRCFPKSPSPGRPSLTTELCPTPNTGLGMGRPEVESSSATSALWSSPCGKVRVQRRGSPFVTQRAERNCVLKVYLS